MSELLCRLAARLGIGVLARARSPVLLLVAATLFVFDVVSSLATCDRSTP